MGVHFFSCPSCDEITTDCSCYSCDTCEDYYCDTCMSGNNVGCKVCSLEVVPTLTILEYICSSTCSLEMWEAFYRTEKRAEGGMKFDAWLKR